MCDGSGERAPQLRTKKPAIAPRPCRQILLPVAVSARLLGG